MNISISAKWSYNSRHSGLAIRLAKEFFVCLFVF